VKSLFPLLLVPVLAHAGVAYDVAVRDVDESNLSLGGAPPASTVTHCFVEDGKVRIAAASGKMAYLFEGSTMYVIDNPLRTVHLLRHATLSQFAAHYADAVKQLETAAANSPAPERPAAEQKAADMRAVSERLREPVAREYRVTARFESVDGRACRIWEEREGEAKRLELCVAPAAGVPGATDILNGMKTLSQFRQGSDFAFGIDFGLSEWWADFSSLAGLPLLIREYKYDSVVSEVMLTGLHTGVPRAGQLDVPAGYQIQAGPDYTQWYVR